MENAGGEKRLFALRTYLHKSASFAAFFVFTGDLLRPGRGANRCPTQLLHGAGSHVVTMTSLGNAAR